MGAQKQQAGGSHRGGARCVCACVVRALPALQPARRLAGLQLVAPPSTSRLLLRVFYFASKGTVIWKFRLPWIQ